MALSNQTPLRPFITLTQMLPDGSLVPGRENIYQIPYNYISDFNIEYSTSGLGQVKLTLFDLDYDWILNGLLSQTYLSGGSPDINFLITFGWQEGLIDSIVRNVWPKGISSLLSPGKYIDRYSGGIEKEGSIRSNYDKVRQIISQPHIVKFIDIGLQLSEVGVELNLQGINTFSEGFKLLMPTNDSGKGWPWEILDRLLRNVGIETDWKFGKRPGGHFILPEFDTEKTKEFDKNPYLCNNKMLGDCIKELLDLIYIDGEPGQLDYYTNNFHRIGDVVRPTITIFKKNQRIDSCNFLGNYNYFTGKESHIIDSITFNIEDLVPFLGHTIENNNVDVGNKSVSQTTTQADNKNTNPDLNKSKTKKEQTYTKTETSKIKGVHAALSSPAQPKGTSFSSEDMANLQNYFYQKLQSFTIKADLNILGDPGIDFMDLKTQSFLELNIHKQDGTKMDLLSGNYYIDKITHTINNTEFNTSLSIVKWQFVKEEDLKPSRE
jgi:hypothetical protein